MQKKSLNKNWSAFHYNKTCDLHKNFVQVMTLVALTKALPHSILFKTPLLLLFHYYQSNSKIIKARYQGCYTPKYRNTAKINLIALTYVLWRFQHCSLFLFFWRQVLWVCFCFFLTMYTKLAWSLLCSPTWPQICNPPSSTSQMLGLQVYATMYRLHFSLL